MSHFPFQESRNSGTFVKIPPSSRTESLESETRSGAWTESCQEVTRTRAVWGQAPTARMRGVGCFTHTQESSGESRPQHISFSCILLVRTGHCHGTLPAWGWKHSIYQKNGRKRWGHFVCNGLAFNPSVLTGRLSSPNRDSLYRKGLNRPLPRQTKPVWSWPYRPEKRQDREEAVCLKEPGCS